MKTKPADVPFCGVNAKRITEANPLLDTQNLEHLYNFIHRRYLIHLRKDVLHKDPPWINDSVLREYRFTNVRREHDRETRWLIKNITSNPDLSYSDKILNVILFRLFNKHETSELIQQPIRFKDLQKNPNQYKYVLDSAKDSGQFLYTGAFFTTGMRQGVQATLTEAGFPADFSGNDLVLFVNYINQDGIVDNIGKAKDQKGVFNALCKYKGLGSFLSYQIFVDLTYIDEFPFSENEFTVAGPGCKKGLDMLFKDRNGMTHEECLFWVRDHIEEEFKHRLGKSLDPQRLFADLPEYDRCLNVMSLENCFCELSKYIRAITNTGRPRKKYKQNKEEL